MSTENTTPATDLDDPYIARYADKCEDPDEVLLRADYARALAHRTQALNYEVTGDREFEQLMTAADEMEQRWTSRDEASKDIWYYLDNALQEWAQAPADMRRFHDEIRAYQAMGLPLLTDTEWRSQLQARELAHHGAWEQEQHQEAERADQRGDRDFLWTDPAEIRANVPVPVSADFARARTAQLGQSIPGHAFAGLITGRDQDKEIER